jgi:hypothetical protein
MRATNGCKIHKNPGGAMSNQDKTTETTIIVGASGSVGILPDGVFAKILSGTTTEQCQPEIRSEEPRDDR